MIYLFSIAVSFIMISGVSHGVLCVMFTDFCFSRFIAVCMSYVLYILGRQKACPYGAHK